MSARKSKKITTDGGGDLGASPFAGLDSSTLPAGGVPVPTRGSARKSALSKKNKGRVEVRREKTGRGGKTVTTLRDFPSHIPLATLEAMTLDLKRICACGGTLKGRDIELQGDLRDRVCLELDSRGYQTVRAGG